MNSKCEYCGNPVTDPNPYETDCPDSGDNRPLHDHCAALYITFQDKMEITVVSEITLDIAHQSDTN